MNCNIKRENIKNFNKTLKNKSKDKSNSINYNSDSISEFKPKSKLYTNLNEYLNIMKNIKSNKKNNYIETSNKYSIESKLIKYDINDSSALSSHIDKDIKNNSVSNKMNIKILNNLSGINKIRNTSANSLLVNKSTHKNTNNLSKDKTTVDSIINSPINKVDFESDDNNLNLKNKTLRNVFKSETENNQDIEKLNFFPFKGKKYKFNNKFSKLFKSGRKKDKFKELNYNSSLNQEIYKCIQDVLIKPNSFQPFSRKRDKSYEIEKQSYIFKDKVDAEMKLAKKMKIKKIKIKTNNNLFSYLIRDYFVGDKADSVYSSK